MEFHGRCYIILIFTGFLLLTMETEGHKHANELIKVAGYVLYKKDPTHGRLYLLIEQKKHGRKWTPPKGRVEEKETEEETAIRELTEETGLTSTDINIDIDSKQLIKPPKSNHPKEITFWNACLHTDKPINLSAEHLQYKWLPYEEAKKIVDDDTKIALEYAENFIEKSNKRLI